MRKTFNVTCLGRKLSCEIELKLEGRDKFSWELKGIEFVTPDFQPRFDQLPDSTQIDIEMIAESIALEESLLKFPTEDELAGIQENKMFTRGGHE